MKTTVINKPRVIPVASTCIQIFLLKLKNGSILLCQKRKVKHDAPPFIFCTGRHLESRLFVGGSHFRVLELTED